MSAGRKSQAEYELERLLKGNYVKPERAPGELDAELMPVWWKIEEQIEKLVPALPALRGKATKASKAREKAFKAAQQANAQLESEEAKLRKLLATRDGLPKRGGFQ